MKLNAEMRGDFLWIFANEPSEEDPGRGDGRVGREEVEVGTKEIEGSVVEGSEEGGKVQRGELVLGEGPGGDND